MRISRRKWREQMQLSRYKGEHRDSGTRTVGSVEKRKIAEVINDIDYGERR